MFDDFNISPYPGLRSFSEDESLFFKGRDSHILEIVKLLQANKFLMVTGASGDGKSSIIFSGLIPNIRAGFFNAHYNRWEVAHFRPERSPVRNLASALSNVLDSTADTIQTELNRGYGSLIDLYKGSDLHKDETTNTWQEADEEEKRKIDRSTANLLIVADQFEEFFTNPENFRKGAPSEESQVLVNLLLETAKIALRDNIPVYVVFTMRSDYIGQCASFRELPEFIGFSQFFVPRLKRKELKQIIEEPAKLNGNSISPRLVERILYDMKEGVDQLPILQHALGQVWLMANMGKDEMDLIHYAKVGGMSPSDLPESDKQHYQEWYISLEQWQQEQLQNPGLARILDIHADQLYEGSWAYYQSKNPTTILSKKECKLIIAISFACLTKIDHSRAVRNRMTLQEITDIINIPKITAEVVGLVLNAFREQGNTFIRPFIEENDSESLKLTPETVLDITHESLIRNWKRLANWANKEFEYYETYLDFEKQLEKWLKSSKNSGYLLPIGPLTFFENWEQECKPNKYWINRYNTESDNIEENLKSSERRLKESREFLKKSARKLIVSKSLLKYGTLRIAVAFAVALVALLSGYYYYDALQKQNAYVLETIARKAPASLESQEVGNDDKAFYLLSLERVYPGAMIDEITSIPDVDKRIEVALDTYGFLFILDRSFSGSEKNDLVNFINDNISQSGLSAEKKLFYHNKFIDLLGYDYYLNNEVLIGSVLQENTIQIPGLIIELVTIGDVNRILIINQGIENYMNWSSDPSDGIEKFIDLLSPFESESLSRFKQIYPQEAGILNGRRGNISHNGGYQQLASLYATQGNLEYTVQATDSIIKYNKNYFDLLTFNNGTNILGYFAQFDFPKEAEEYLGYISAQSGLSRQKLMNYTMDHGGSIKYFYVGERLFDEVNYNPNLSILHQRGINSLFDLYEEVLKEDFSGDDRAFYLAILYKQRGAYLSWQQHLPAVSTSKELVYEWFDKAFSQYRSISDKYKLENEEINYRYWGDGIRTKKYPKKYFFNYPDYFYSQWHSDKFVSTSFMAYLLEKNLFDELYKTADDLEGINDWLANYYEIFPFSNEARNLAPFNAEILSETLSAISALNASDGFDKTYLNLLLANVAFKDGNTQQGLEYYKDIDIAKINSLANRWQYLNYTAIYNELVLLAKSLSLNGYHKEAMALIESTPDSSYKTYIYSVLSNYLYINQQEPISFTYLDSAFSHEKKYQAHTLQFQNDPHFPMINALSGIGGTTLNNMAKDMFREMEPGWKAGGLFNYVQGIAWGGNYYRAIEAIPEQISSGDELALYTLIMAEEANKIGTQENWKKATNNWNLITKDYIFFRDQNN